MNEEYRPIEVVDMGGTSTSPTPGRPPRDRTEVLLLLLLVGVFLGAACSAFTAWTTYAERQDARELQCIYLSSGGEGASRSYDDLAPFEQSLADTYDCDLEGR